jgi:hypothetical protein
MDYLEAWNKGFESGRKVDLDLINSYCNMKFETLTDVIVYIREVEFNKRLEADCESN